MTYPKNDEKPIGEACNTGVAANSEGVEFWLGQFGNVAPEHLHQVQLKDGIHIS